MRRTYAKPCRKGSARALGHSGGQRSFDPALGFEWDKPDPVWLRSLAPRYVGIWDGAAMRTTAQRFIEARVIK